MLLNNMKTRLFTAFLAVLILLPSCAMYAAKDKLPLESETAESDTVNEDGVENEPEIPVTDELPSENEGNENEGSDVVEDDDIDTDTELPAEKEEKEDKNEDKSEDESDVKVDVDRPGVGSSGSTEKVFVPYDVPLTIEQQKIVEKVAERFYISEELIFGVMKVESKYNVNAIGKNANYLGIMQISKSNLKILKQYCGVTDLMDFEQNVIAGSYYLRTYLTRYNDDKHISLLYYHGGYKYANKLIANGQYEDSYTRAVIREMNRIVEARRKLANEMGVKLYGGFYEDYT